MFSTLSNIADASHSKTINFQVALEESFTVYNLHIKTLNKNFELINKTMSQIS